MVLNFERERVVVRFLFFSSFMKMLIYGFFFIVLYKGTILGEVNFVYVINFFVRNISIRIWKGLGVVVS